MTILVDVKWYLIVLLEALLLQPVLHRNQFYTQSP